jgi:hypothetical protein
MADDFERWCDDPFTQMTFEEWRATMEALRAEARRRGAESGIEVGLVIDSEQWARITDPAEALSLVAHVGRLVFPANESW